MRNEGKKILKIILLIAGFISLGLGMIGIVIPVLPTTPFLLLAVYCFSKSSKKMLRWILNIPILGKYIRDYRDGKGVPIGVKIFAISMLWITILATAFLAIDKIWLRILLILISSVVTYHIVKIKGGKKTLSR